MVDAHLGRLLVHQFRQIIHGQQLVGALVHHIAAQFLAQRFLLGAQFGQCVVPDLGLLFHDFLARGDGCADKITTPSGTFQHAVNSFGGNKVGLAALPSPQEKHGAQPQPKGHFLEGKQIDQGLGVAFIH